MFTEEYYKSIRAPYGTWKCSFCGLVFESKRKLYQHLATHPEWHKREKTEHFCKYCNTSLGFNQRKGWNNHKITCPVYSQLITSTGHLATEEVKQVMALKRKSYLKENPDKHPWRKKDKFLSKPCEVFKEFLRKNNFIFLEEYIPLTDYNYSIDIAFPIEKIGIEINGNQHYKNLITNELNDYYHLRHNLIEADGWKLLEIHYYNVYLPTEQEKILDLLKKQIQNTDINLLKEYQDRCHTFMLQKQKEKKQQQKQEQLQLRQNFISERKKILDSIDTSKYGWVAEAGRKLNMTTTSVRRWVNKFYPELKTYQRAPVAQLVEAEDSKSS